MSGNGGSTALGDVAVVVTLQPPLPSEDLHQGVFDLRRQI
jgi:hypothetical protein